MMAASSSPGAAVAVLSRAIRATSCPGHGPPTRLTVSRSTLFARFLVTAPPSRFPAMYATRPSWALPSGVLITRTTANGWADLRPSSKTVWISLDDLMVLMAPWFAPRAPYLGAQDLAALPAARSKDRSAGAGGHAGTEAMGLAALPNVRLVCSLHCSSLGCPSDPGQSPTIIWRSVQAVNDRIICGSHLWSGQAPCPLPSPPRTGFAQVRDALQRDAPGAVNWSSNLWTMWKTQDSRLWNLWITPCPPLSAPLRHGYHPTRASSAARAREP